MSGTDVTSFTYLGSNPWISALIWGGAWENGSSTPNVYYAFQSGRDPYSFNGISYAPAWTAAETTALHSVFDAWSAVANIEFTETGSTDYADIWYWKGSTFEVQALAWHEAPEPSIYEPLYGVFSYDAQGWNGAGLLPGGYGFLTLLHEVGHGLGLAHPHDTANGDSTVFPGVTSAYDDYGDYDLNQGIWTLMTYNDGWLTQFPDHAPWLGDETYGYSATPMALDIAAVQEIYGPNTTHASGDDLYALPSSNESGTYWASIWDTGGNDSISAAGSGRPYTIDLREAPLTGPNAGGYPSFNVDVVGGFTIANGVTVEVAIGGGGSDTITGNDADNRLEGRGNNDLLSARAGDDTILGGPGDDTLDGGAGADSIDGGAGRDVLSYESATRSVRLDLQNDAYTYGDAVGDSFAGIEAFQTGGTVDQLRGDEADNTFMAGGLSDRLYGRAGDDILLGEDGADALYGGLGADVMTGGSQSGPRDRYIYFNIAESGVGTGNRDVVTDFVAGEDRIEISRLDADSLTPLKQKFTFVGEAGLSGNAGELAFVHQGGATIVQADVDGDALADFEIELTGLLDLTAQDFLI